ncbi:MAG: hypothetical protein GX575_25325 [Candidatus Anammoximicrobium sp.]|nr:hypothetical protein [Candidatus Anammoximicrobium sp.]
MYEHPSHREERQRRAVSPLIDLTGWDTPAKKVESLEGQQALPGMEGVEQERKWRKRRDEGRGQQHLF